MSGAGAEQSLAAETADPLAEARHILHLVTLVLLELRSRETRALGLDREVARITAQGEGIIRNLGLLHLLTECPSPVVDTTNLEQRHGVLAELFAAVHVAWVDLVQGLEEVARAQIAAAPTTMDARAAHDRFALLLERDAWAPNRSAALQVDLRVANEKFKAENEKFEAAKQRAARMKTFKEGLPDLLGIEEAQLWISRNEDILEGVYTGGDRVAWHDAKTSVPDRPDR